MNTSYKLSFAAGQQITGKWNGRAYLVERKLGEGANGQVYLVRRNQKVYAMKLGTDALDLQSEANILQVLSRMEGSFRHFLADVDDWSDQSREVPFYVMKYVEGVQLQDYLSAKGREWLPLVGLKLLGQLRELHAKGYIFGDLKKENVLVSGYGQVELVDFGGVTPMGKAVKQFTELYDRGYWNAGDRVAEAGYDLFSFGILCILVCSGPKRAFSRTVLPQNRNLEDLLTEVRLDPLCGPYLPFLEKVLLGRFSTTDEAYAQWHGMVRRQTGKKRLPAANRQAMSWVKVGFGLSVLLFGTTLWYYW